MAGMLGRIVERLQKLRGRGAPPEEPAPAEGPREPDPHRDGAARITAYLRDVAQLAQRPLLCEPAIIEAIEQLRGAGRSTEALELGRGLAAAFPADPTVHLLVAELLAAMRLVVEVLPSLQRVLAAHRSATPEQLRRARALLADAALATDDVAAARRHLEALLSEDFGYPGARARLDALRPVPGRVQPPIPSAVSLAGTRGQAGLGEAALPTLVSAGAPGRYRLLRELGCGSAGAVYAALDEELGCEVALKLFHPRPRAPWQDGQRTHDEALLRALHEARLLAASRHPGVVAVYDVLDELAAGGAPLLAMELCRGGSLRQRLGRGPLPAGAALLRAAELCETLAAVHHAEVAHGDLKPENLLFRGPGRHRRRIPVGEAAYGDLVISDFGLARLSPPSPTSQLSKAPGSVADSQGAGLGTFGYLPPERLRGAAVAPAADVFALGVLLLEMLTGEPPRAREQALRGEPLHLPADPPAPWLAAIWPDLHALLGRLTALDPAARPDAAAVGVGLGELRARLAPGEAGHAA